MVFSKFVFGAIYDFLIYRVCKLLNYSYYEYFNFTGIRFRSSELKQLKRFSFFLDICTLLVCHLATSSGSTYPLQQGVTTD